MSLKVYEKHEVCYDCKLADESVETGGIWYCPNPFCGMSGATNWKTKNLNVRRTGDGYELLNNEGWLEKGLAKVGTFPDELRKKIMALTVTKKRIKELMEELTK